MDIVRTSEPAIDAGRRIGGAIRTATEAGQSVLLHIAGGSAAAVLDSIPFDLPYQKVTCAVTDERVSTASGENNFAALSASAWFVRAEDEGMEAIDTTAHVGESPEALRDRFDAAVRTWHDRNPGGAVIGLFGIGTDGHTAGMIPGCLSDAEFEERFCGDAWVATLDATGVNPFPERVTLTLSYIKDRVDTAIVYAVGKEKKVILDKILTSDAAGEGSAEGLAAMPALVFKNHSESVIVTDSE
jgi:6-phosphogluconolactonase/glucosamine-6-phosphate isomerase/deaminase